MSYLSAATLRADATFERRVQSCVIEQAQTFKDDKRPDYAELAINIVQTGGGGAGGIFVPNLAAAPGFADKDPAAITDADILAAVQAIWPAIGAAYRSTTDS